MKTPHDRQPDADSPDAAVDELLRAHARTWSRRQPEPPSIPHGAALADFRPARPRRGLAVAASTVAILGVALAAAVHTSDRAAPDAQTTPSRDHSTGASDVRTRLARIASDAAAPDRGRIIRAEAVQTTYIQAERDVFDGDTSNTFPDDTRVWVVQIEGRGFLCTSCKTPPGFPAERGRVITLVLQAHTFTQSDFAFGPHTHDLARLGQVITLHP